MNKLESSGALDPAGVADLLKAVFPRLGTDEEMNGADTVDALAELYRVLRERGGEAVEPPPASAGLLYRVALPAEVIFDVPGPDGLSDEEAIGRARSLLDAAIDAEEGFDLDALRGGRVYPGLQDTCGWASSAEDWRVVDHTDEDGC